MLNGAWIKQFHSILSFLVIETHQHKRSAGKLVVDSLCAVWIFVMTPFYGNLHENQLWLWLSTDTITFAQKGSLCPSLLGQAQAFTLISCDTAHLCLVTCLLLVLSVPLFAWPGPGLCPLIMSTCHMPIVCPCLKCVLCIYFEGFRPFRASVPVTKHKRRYEAKSRFLKRGKMFPISLQF